MNTDYELAQNLHKRHLALLPKNAEIRLQLGALYQELYFADRFRLLNPDDYNDVNKEAAWMAYCQDYGLHLRTHSLQRRSELAGVYRKYVVEFGMADISEVDFSLSKIHSVLLDTPLYILTKMRDYWHDRKECYRTLKLLPNHCSNPTEFSIWFHAEWLPQFNTDTDSELEDAPLLPTTRYIRSFQKVTNAKGDMILKAFSHLPLGTLTEIDTNSEYIVKVSFERISVAQEV